MSHMGRLENMGSLVVNLLLFEATGSTCTICRSIDSIRQTLAAQEAKRKSTKLAVGVELSDCASSAS